jgi:hypothetical protein
MSNFQENITPKDPLSTPAGDGLSTSPGWTNSPKRKRIRRSKDARAPRNYLCGCGKTYLSYAALYTHTKTKHGGVFPEGTTTLSRRKQIQSLADDWRHVRTVSEYQKTYHVNKEFQLFLGKIPKALEEGEKRPKDLIEFFPCEKFRDINDCRGLLVAMEQIRIELTESYGNEFIPQIDIIIFEINNSKKLNCFQAIALFLIYVFRFCSKAFYSDLVFLFAGYTKMLNQRGWKVVAEGRLEGGDPETPGTGPRMLRLRDTQIIIPVNLGESATEPPKGEFCETQTAEFLPVFANDFMQEYFADCLTTDSILVSPKSLSFFRMDALSLLWVVVLLKFFCHWLYIHRFSKSRIEVHKE